MAASRESVDSVDSVRRTGGAQDEAGLSGVTGTGSIWPGATWDAWRATVERDLKGAPFEKRLVSETYEGIDIQPLYSARDYDHTGDPCGAPGVMPMVRGPGDAGRVRLGWDVREERAEPDLEALNTAILEDLEHGATSIDIRLNDASLHGLKATSPIGAMVLCADDLDAALRGVHLEMVGVGVTAGSAYAEASAMLDAVYGARGVDRATARVAFNADPIAELARAGTLPAPVETMLARLGGLALWSGERYPLATAARVNTAPYHDACANASEDLACSIATGIVYLRAMERSGVSLDRAARQIVFQYSVSCNFFLAASKLRAARRLWARVLEACGVAPGSVPMRIEVRTGRRSLTHRDPWVNILRNTAGCFAAAVGGADAVLSVPYDEPLGLPDALGRRIARNTQAVLGEEAGLHRVLDPAGGSWYLETLTDAVSHAAWALVREIESLGGMVAALRTGWVHDRLAASYAARLRNISKRKDAVTGVSEFPNVRERVPAHDLPDPAALAKSASRRMAKRSDDGVALTAALGAACGNGGMMASLAEAASHGATSDQLRHVLSGDEVGDRIVPLAPHPYAEPFEALRDAADAFEGRHGRRPTVFTVAMGSPAEFTPRVTFAGGFFGAGGFEVLSGDRCETPDAAADRLKESGSKIAVICSSDKRYPEIVPALAARLREAGARTVILAGRPGEHESGYRAAGVDRFIFMGCDVVEALRGLLHEEGALA